MYTAEETPFVELILWTEIKHLKSVTLNRYVMELATTRKNYLQLGINVVAIERL